MDARRPPAIPIWSLGPIGAIILPREDWTLAADTQPIPTVTRTSTAPDRAFLLASLAEAYAGPAWHGPTLRASIRGVELNEALWRPGEGRNCIWDLVLHTAYGKYLVASRLEPDPDRKFARKLARSWWPRLPDPADAQAWRADQQLLQESHEHLLEVCARAPAGRFRERRMKSRFTLGQEVHGLALHDIYHAGQIRLLRRLHADSR